MEYLLCMDNKNVNGALGNREILHMPDFFGCFILSTVTQKRQVTNTAEISNTQRCDVTSLYEPKLLYNKLLSSSFYKKSDNSNTVTWCT